MLVLVESESVVARALIRADGVLAFMLAAAVVLRALINVGQEDGSEARLLNRFVRLELEPQDAPIAGHRVGNFAAAEHAVLFE